MAKTAPGRPTTTMMKAVNLNLEGKEDEAKQLLDSEKHRQHTLANLKRFTKARQEKGPYEIAGEKAETQPAPQRIVGGRGKPKAAAVGRGRPTSNEIEATNLLFDGDEEAAKAKADELGISWDRIQSLYEVRQAKGLGRYGAVPKAARKGRGRGRVAKAQVEPEDITFHEERDVLTMIDGRTKMSTLIKLEAKIQTLLQGKDKKQIEKMRKAAREVEELKKQLAEREALLK